MITFTLSEHLLADHAAEFQRMLTTLAVTRRKRLPILSRPLMYYPPSTVVVGVDNSASRAL